MAEERTYSTREVAQMWNVSESTIKRWADSEDLRCYRTPGGHRRFRLEDLCEFQQKQGFEASGMLSSSEWEEPDLEVWLNRKAFDKVTELIRYLAEENQRGKIRDLLERLYIRGMRLDQIYDEVLIPLARDLQRCRQTGAVPVARCVLAGNNLEEAVSALTPHVPHRRKNGRTGLCGAPYDRCQFLVNAVCRILDVEGWDRLNLGEQIPCQAMAEIVQSEPINLVCVVASQPPEPELLKVDFAPLFEAADRYRIPLVLAGDGFAGREVRDQLPHTDYFPKLRGFRSFLVSAAR